MLKQSVKSEEKYMRSLTIHKLKSCCLVNIAKKKLLVWFVVQELRSCTIFIEGWRLKVTKSNFQSQLLNKKILKKYKKLNLKVKNVKNL